MLDKDPQKIQRMFGEIAHRYDTANRLLSMRFDVAWRKHLARRLIARPGVVLDIAAGTGDLTVALARFGGHRVVSADFTFEMLVQGREKVRRGATGSPQVAADALSLPFRTASFDAATIAFGVRNFADATRGMAEIRRTLRHGGALGILEFSTPHRTMNVFYAWYFRHILPRLGGLITGSRKSYEYLPQSVSEFPEGPAFLSLMKDAGYVRATAQRLTGGIVTFYRGENP